MFYFNEERPVEAFLRADKLGALPGLGMNEKLLLGLWCECSRDRVGSKFLETWERGELEGCDMDWRVGCGLRRGRSMIAVNLVLIIKIINIFLYNLPHASQA